MTPSRTSTKQPAFDARSAIERAMKSEEYVPAPRARGRGKRALTNFGAFLGDDDIDEAYEGIAARAEELHRKDARSDGPLDAWADTPDLTAEMIQVPLDELQGAALFAEAQAAGRLPASATKYRVDKTGGVWAINARGHRVKELRKATRTTAGTFASSEQVQRVRAGRPPVGTKPVEFYALPRVIRLVKSAFGAQEEDHQGLIAAAIPAWWQGYKRAHPDVRGKVKVSGDTARVVDEDGSTITTSKITNTRNWRTGKFDDREDADDG